MAITELDDAIVAAMVREMMTIDSAMVVVFEPETVIQLVGALQLATRHPRFTGKSREGAQRFINAARQYFAECPTVLDVLRRGDDPAEDR